MTETYRHHPIADSLPDMSREGYEAFRDRMRLNGYDPRYPIVIYEGKILDGRHRYRAATELGIEPQFVFVPETTNPWEVAITGELRRNYATETQRVMCLRNLVQQSEAWVSERQKAQDAANRARSEAASERRVGRAAAKRKEEEFSDATFGGTTKPNNQEPIHDAAKGGASTTEAPKSKPNRSSESLAAALGVGRKAVEEAEWLERNATPEIVDAVKAGEMKPAEAKRVTKREEIKAHLNDVAAREIVQPTGLFDVVVIDPPWPMEKVERDCRPNQLAFDYPVMNESELSELSIPVADDCHVWVWTTHKFLPMALRLLDVWSLKYVCTFVWHKPGGFQPFGLPQFNCEFALYARHGSPKFVDTAAFSTCFSGSRGRHSEKPEEFYEMVRRVTGGRRLDMFNRRSIDGFSGWGNEAAA